MSHNARPIAKCMWYAASNSGKAEQLLEKHGRIPHAINCKTSVPKCP